MPPERHLNLTGGFSAAVTRVVCAPFCKGDTRVCQDRVQRETQRVSLNDTPGLDLDHLKADAEGLLSCDTCKEERGLLVQRSERKPSPW